MKVKFITVGIGMALWLVLSWVLPAFLSLAPAKIFALQLILSFFGLLVGAVLIWYFLKTKPEATFDHPSNGELNIDSVLREAQAKLAVSPLGRNAQLNKMPVIFLTGPAGSAKTTTVMQSGLEPELLAGQANKDGAVVATTIANAWLSQNAFLLEVGPAIQSAPESWQTISNYVQPGKLESAVGRAQASSRAIVVCYECENFLKPGAAKIGAEVAQSIRSQLFNISAALGANLPVYVLFTKLDRVAFFLDYAKNLHNQEATQPFGATLAPDNSTSGVYAERQTQRIGNAFQELVASLNEKRTQLLTREADPSSTLSAYEFPREFAKLRGALVTFLLELCRPSRLNVAPFLRGFYFCGVRPVVVEEEAPAWASVPAQSNRPPNIIPDASSIFSVGSVPVQPQAPPPVSRGAKRRVPQWVFLPRFFNEVILADRSGLAASAGSIKTNFLRRLLLASIAVVCVLFGIFTLVSFIKNKDLVTNVHDAATAVIASNPDADAVTLDSLQKLDSLRASLVQLRDYERTHPPLSMRWGLYSGSAILPDTQRLYFDSFKALLFGKLQTGMLNAMRNWSLSPQPNENYGYDYNTLKANPETTANAGKATLQFLPPLLQDRWVAGRTVDPAQVTLARRQFDFYTSQLIEQNPYTNDANQQVIQKARSYLAQFAGVKRVYQSMLTEANQNVKPVIFNQRFPGSSAVVINNREVSGAFTKPGFTFMENAIKNPAKYASGEKWVLGDQYSAVGDTQNLAQQIRDLYYAEYIASWRDYLKKSSVVKYPNLPAAVQKLTLTSSPQSPLLALFWLASQNTDVSAAPVQQAFKPLHSLMPPASVDQYVLPSNSNYMTALTSLQSTLDQASKLPPEQMQQAADQTTAAATSALLTTRQTALTLGLDPDAHIEATIQQLMEDPITYIDAVKPNGASPAPLNGAGSDFCSKYRPLMSKYPFDPNSKTPASIDEVNAVFRPQQGTLWQFYDQKLNKLLAKQGNVYAPIPGAKPALTNHFVAFFNNAARFSNTLFANGASQDPKINFALQPAFSDLQTVALTVNGQTANFTPNSPSQKFAWPGSAGGVRLVAKSGGSEFNYPNYDGLWGLFEFFSDADRPVPSPEWMLKSGRSDKPVTSPLTNQPIIVHFNVDMLGAPPVFQKGYFRDLACVSEVAH